MPKLHEILKEKFPWLGTDDDDEDSDAGSGADVIDDLNELYATLLSTEENGSTPGTEGVLYGVLGYKPGEGIYLQGLSSADESPPSFDAAYEDVLRYREEGDTAEVAVFWMDTEQLCLYGPDTAKAAGIETSHTGE